MKYDYNSFCTKLKSNIYQGLHKEMMRYGKIEETIGRFIVGSELVIDFKNNNGK
jgi:hypothetical protein